uniref:Non-structural protein 4a protein n=1 Tax=Murine hepatitis virus TaxID=11138 RepID=Q86583_9BETC|nr:non-structural protein 4a [Murine hepatitis virus]AAX23983.1 ORF4a [synthetic construct]
MAVLVLRLHWLLSLLVHLL